MAITQVNRRQFQSLFDTVASGSVTGTVTGAFTANTIQSQNITVPGAALGDLVLVWISANGRTVRITGNVSAADTVTVAYAPENNTTAIGAHTVYYVVLRPATDVIA